MKIKATFNFLLLLVLSVSLLASASALVDSSYIIYNDSAAYNPSSHTYGITNLYVSYVTIDLKGTSGGESGCLIFTYTDGLSSSAICQNVPYLSWVTNTYTNPNPSKNVASVTLNGGTHTYMKNFFAYGNSDGYTETPITSGPQTDSLCGNNVMNTGEECDGGEENGNPCTSEYGSSCNYCSTLCKTKTVRGEYCGDGRLNTEFERCDDGNRIDRDQCTNECKKPFAIIVEDFAPLVWECYSRVVYDDATEPGRVSEDGQALVERINNYAFEGEQVQWRVLVLEKNGIEKVGDVYITVGGNMEANCVRLPNSPNSVEEINADAVYVRGVDPSCNARILEEELTEFNSRTMAYYLCTLTVETPESMYGKDEITVEVTDINGEIGAMDEMEYWFLNPEIALSISEEGLVFDDGVRPGTLAYSDTLLVGNDADRGSGVMLDMFISGTDFYDKSSSGAKCGTSNQLELSNFASHATNGAYSSDGDLQNGRTCDAEGYCNINYGIGFNNPKPFYNRNEILQAQQVGPYYTANLLAPGAEFAITFRLELPEPCNGDFDAGHIYFWGEAV